MGVAITFHTYQNKKQGSANVSPSISHMTPAYHAPIEHIAGTHLHSTGIACVHYMHSLPQLQYSTQLSWLDYMHSLPQLQYIYLEWHVENGWQQ